VHQFYWLLLTLTDMSVNGVREGHIKDAHGESLQALLKPSKCLEKRAHTSMQMSRKVSCNCDLDNRLHGNLNYCCC
jgi:hypothetical protein